jgi:hypothetical protein
MNIEDYWEKDYEGRCDLCRKEKPLSEVHPAIQYSWRAGYVCRDCSPNYHPKIIWEE